MVRVPIRQGGASEERDGPSSEPATHATLSLHPVSASDALIVKVTPPRAPIEDVPHVACDIVLVIDISGSMGAAADVPGEVESTGLSVLDLTKHAAMTIIETLDDRDRLGIVTFGSRSSVVLPLTSMTDASKDVARAKVREIESRDATNLWHGILDGIKLFNEGGTSTRVPALMILTDGRPNHMCPQQGYISKLRTMQPLPASVHTFGFGYNLESGLLKSIAELGGGNYAFIPDAGMIGTVFVHAVANLQSTFATEAELTLECRGPLSVYEACGGYIGQNLPETVDSKQRLTLRLDNLQFGQTRDIFIFAKWAGDASSDDKANAGFEAHLAYCVAGGKKAQRAAHAACSLLEDSGLADEEIAYHESRAQLCSFLASVFPVGPKEKHTALKGEAFKNRVAELPQLIEKLPAQKYSDPFNRSLVEDLAGEEPAGQISLALQSPDYFRKWGVHFLPSIHSAHFKQICNSFKDPGPLQYGTQSPLFLACRDRLDAAFDSLPAPEPTSQHYLYRGGDASTTSYTPISMSRYHNPMGSCFAGSSPVELASGRHVAIRKLRRGVKVRTPAGPRKVAAVLRTPVTEETMCQVRGGILVTPWHPIAGDGAAKAWGFPAHVSERRVRYTGSVYSVMLQRGDGNPRGHALRVGGVWGVTLGHGVISGGDARAHAFFGDYRRVAKAFLGLGIDKAGIVVGAGVERDEATGMVCGFRRPAAPLLGQECVVS